MATKIVKLAHNIALKSGILAVRGIAWGRNALQTITIARRTPYNPQQAVGFKGVVDYTSAPVTSEVTLDCILTENCTKATTETSVYKHADSEVEIGQESYALTSCALNFQAGNPATVNYGYITAGLASALIANANPEVLKAGDEAAFAVVMGEDGTGVYLVGKKADNSVFVIPAGVQTLGFNTTLNRNQILDVRKSSPIQFVTTYPIDSSMNLEVLQKIADVTLLNSLAVSAGADATGTYGLINSATGNVDGLTGENADGKTQVFSSYDAANALGAATGIYVKACGLKKTEEGESINVGGNLTFTYQFTAADIEIPLNYVGQTSNSSGYASDESTSE